MTKQSYNTEDHDFHVIQMLAMTTGFLASQKILLIVYCVVVMIYYMHCMYALYIIRKVMQRFQISTVGVLYTDFSQLLLSPENILVCISLLQ